MQPFFDFLDTDFFVLRTPVLPLGELLGWSAGLRMGLLCDTGADSQEVEQAWNADVQLLRDRLREISHRPEIIHALFVASPSLQPGIEHWIRDPNSKKGVQAERALVRYFTRMCARPTPFALFSGCSVGRLEPNGDAGTALRLQPRKQYRVCSRLDFDYLCELSDGLRRDPAVGAKLHYQPNSSLNRFGESWRYVATRFGDSGRTHQRMEVEDDQHLHSVLECARTGATVPELVKAVSDCGEIDEEKARSYVRRLIDKDVLTSDFAPPLTGGSPIDDLILQAEALPFTDGVADTLRWTRDRLATLDRQGLGASPAEYRLIASRLEALPAKADLAHMYQVDMIKPVQEAILAKPVIDELTWGVEVLRRLSQRSEPEALRFFRTAFTERYDRAIVPLLEALDEEAGIGLGSAYDPVPLIHGLQQSNLAATSDSVQLDPRLLQKVAGCLGQSKMELELDISDLPSGEWAPALPDSFALMSTLIARSEEALRNGDFQLKLGGVWGPDGARYLARFCHAYPELERRVREHLRQEEACDPEAIYAEVVHLPEERIANVLNRPVLREYELVYLGRSGASPNRQLPANDLLLGVNKGRFVLYSQTLGRRIIPRLTSAHGYMNPLLAPVYRFLCLLQRQGGTRIGGFSWGALDLLEFLPRVRIGRLVLAAAQWRITSAEIQELAKHQASRLFASMQELRHRRGLPRWVVLEESDQVLPVDLDNALSVDAFVHVLKRQSQGLLREMLPSPDDLCVTGPEGGYCHELCVPFVRRPQAEAADQTPAPAVPATDAKASMQVRATSGTRSLPQGSEWLYLKLYGGHATLDRLLRDTLPSLLYAALSSETVSSWFFLRFSDPHQHLRIRFQGSPDRLRQELLPLVYSTFNPLLASGKIWKIQFDTYEREIERYGGLEGVRAAEEIFFRDSEAVLSILQALKAHEGPDDRWRIALLGADILLSDFGFDLSAKRTAMEWLSNKYRHEFGVSGDRKRILAEKFRAQRAKLEALWWASDEQDQTLALARGAFELRSDRLANVTGRLRSLAQDGRLSMDMSELVASFIHMHINRLVRSSPRQHECVLYDFLFRVYDGRLARLNSSAKSEHSG